MKIYLDTSSLVKLYHDEVGTEELDKIFNNYVIDQIFLSEIAKLEFNSAIWKKVRAKDISSNEAKEIIEAFEFDVEKYTFILIDSSVIEDALSLLSKYGSKGLRSLDAIQLASVLQVEEKISFAKTADELLKDLMINEDIKIL